MVALAVDLPAGPRGASHPKVSMVSDTGVVVTLPYAPNEYDVKGHAPAFEELPRPGRDPLLQRTGGNLQTMTMTLTIVRPDRSSIEDVLAQLVKLIGSGERIRIGYSLLTQGLWRITDNGITALDHEEGTNRCVKASAALTLRRASDATVALGPVSGGLKPTAKPKATVARSGDSGAALAKRTNAVAKKPKATTTKKSTSRVGQLADANALRDFRKLHPGSTVRPPKTIL